MTDWIVIPFRGPEGAKSRLAPVLSEAARGALALAMFEHVLACATTADATHVLVLTPSPTAAGVAERAGARVLVETAGSLNAALDIARGKLRSEGANSLAIIAADLPDITSGDIAALRAGRGAGIAIAPDHTGRGTNALSLPLDCALPFLFGPESLTAHMVAAQRLALPITVVSRPSLARDVDVPADLPLDEDASHVR